MCPSNVEPRTSSVEHLTGWRTTGSPAGSGCPNWLRAGLTVVRRSEVAPIDLGGLGAFGQRLKTKRTYTDEFRLRPFVLAKRPSTP